MTESPSRQPPTLTLDALAAAVARAPDEVCAWQQLGLLAGEGAEFPLLDLERCRLILHAERRGFTAAEIAEVCRSQGDVLGEFADELCGGRPRIGRPIDLASEAAGVDADLLRRIWIAAGLGDQSEVYDDDLQAFRAIRAVLDAGLPEEAVLQLLRVYVDALGRVAETEDRLFHYYVHERLRAEGLEGEALTAATNAAAQPILRQSEPAVLYFHRKALQRALRDDLMLHLAEAKTPPAKSTAEMVATIVFVDLSGFTSLAQSMGDDSAAEVIDRFSELVREAVAPRGGRLVKQIGDEFMLAFFDPTSAVECALAIDDRVRTETRFPAVRIGAHHGPLLYREGDYVGTTVNIAARIAGEAGRDQLLISEALRRHARVPADVEILPAGRQSLRGIVGEVEVHELRRATSVERAFDPVCRMALAPGQAAVTFMWRGRTLSFCSDGCARQFEADPSRYEPELA